MSNNNSPFEFDVVPCTDVEPEVLPETAEQFEEAPAPKKKTAATRIFGALIALLSVAAFFVPVQVLKNAFEPAQMTLLNAVMGLFGGEAVSNVFGVLPVFTDATTAFGMFAGIAFYVLVAGLAFGALFGLLALISGKTCCLRTATFFFAFGTGVNAYYGLTFAAMDVIAVALAAVGALIYLVLAFKKGGKKTFAKVFQLLLSVVVYLAFVICLGFDDPIAEVFAAFGLTYELVAMLLVFGQGAIVALGAIRLQTVKGLAFDLVRYIASFALSVLVVYAAITGATGMMMFAGAAAGVSVLQIIIGAVQKKAASPKAEPEEVLPAPVPAPAPEFVVEEFAEALPYEGGPVEGVEVAQEVNPTFEENMLPAQVNTAGYDFYNCKSFDPFIATLNNEERNQFTELFILRYKGVMPEIPDYVVGGDNKEFFRKMFIYLGQYRDRVPDGLLAKMYQFAIKLS